MARRSHPFTERPDSHPGENCVGWQIDIIGEHCLLAPTPDEQAQLLKKSVGRALMATTRRQLAFTLPLMIASLALATAAGAQFARCMTAKGNRIGGPPVAEPVYVYAPPYYWGPRYYFSYGW